LHSDFWLLEQWVGTKKHRNKILYLWSSLNPGPVDFLCKQVPQEIPQFEGEERVDCVCVFLLFWGGLRKFISGNPTMVMDGDDASSNSLEEVLSAVCACACV
jgi:hypothetical protein